MKNLLYLLLFIILIPKISFGDRQKVDSIIVELRKLKDQYKSNCYYQDSTAEVKYKAIYSLGVQFYRMSMAYDAEEIFLHLNLDLKNETAYRNEKLKINVCNHLANIYLQNAQYATSIYYNQEAYSIALDNNFSEEISSILIGIGTAHRSIENYSIAHRYYNEALLVCKNMVDCFYANYHNGYCFFLEGNFEKAKEYYINALSINWGDAEDTGNYMVYNLLGDLYSSRDADSSIFFYNWAIKIRGNYDYEQLCHSYNGSGKVYLKTGRINEAKSLFQKCLSIATQYSYDTHILNSASNLLQIAQKENNTEMYSRYSKIIIELYKKKSDDKHEFKNVLESKNIIANNKIENDVLSKKIKIEKNKSKNRLLIILGTLLALLILSYLTYYYFRLLKQRNKAFEELSNISNQLSVAKQKLEIANSKLANSNSNLNQYAGTIAHDLKNPLTTIKLYSDLLNSKYDNIDDERKKSYVNNISNGLDRLVNMINHLLNFSKIDATIEKENLQLNEILNIVQEQLEFVISEKKAVITTSSLPNIVSNKYLTIELFQNFISNAIKYSNPENQPHIKVYESNKFHKENFCCIAIEDNGIGIDEKHFEIIFQSFKKVNTDDEDSHGIGLSTCTKIVESIGGSIKIESTVGIGTIFYILLPLKLQLAD